ILAQDFAHVRLWQRFEESYLSWHLVRCKFAPAVRNHLGLGQSRTPSLRHEQPNSLTSLLVRPPNTSAFHYAGTGRGDCFDLVGIKIETRDDDHVLLAITILRNPCSLKMPMSPVRK